MRTWVRRGDHVVVVLPRGADVLEGIETAARESGLASAAFVGIGAIERPRLAWFDREAKTYRDREFEGVWEIASLIGNVTRHDGGWKVHAHLTAAGPDLAARAGHLAGGVVGVTCEVVMAGWDDALVRRMDPAFDLPLIDLD